MNDSELDGRYMALEWSIGLHAMARESRRFVRAMRAQGERLSAVSGDIAAYALENPLLSTRERELAQAMVARSMGRTLAAIDALPER